MTTPSKANPVLIAFSVLAAVDALVLFDGFGDLFPGLVGTWIVAGALVLKVGLGFYVRGVVVPLVNVAARRTSDGELVAGPAAAPADMGPLDGPIPLDTPVTLTRDARTHLG